MNDLVTVHGSAFWRVPPLDSPPHIDDIHKVSSGRKYLDFDCLGVEHLISP
jgi:hypothetical protein